MPLSNSHQPTDTLCASIHIKTTPLPDVLSLHTHLHNSTQSDDFPPAMPHLGLWASHPPLPTHPNTPNIRCPRRFALDAQQLITAQRAEAMSQRLSTALMQVPGSPVPLEEQVGIKHSVTGRASGLEPGAVDQSQLLTRGRRFHTSLLVLSSLVGL